MRSALCSALALLLLLVASSPASTGEVETLVQEALQEIGAEVVDCAETEVPYARERICARFSPTLYAFRTQWNDWMDEAAPASGAESVDDWTMDWGSCNHRDYVVGDGAFRVTLDFRARQANVIYRESPSPTVDIEPAVLEQTEPRFPKAAKKEKIPGRVAVQVRVDPVGGVKDAELVWACPQGYGLEAAAVEAVRDWKFEPAMQGGQAVEASTVVMVDFRLKIKGRQKSREVAATQIPVMID